ncbi:hypothetical protein CsSME_00019407 [Camellia sinensis var. sinensis]
MCVAAGFETILEPASRAPTETFPVQSMPEQRDHPSPNHPSEGLAIYGHSPRADISPMASTPDLLQQASAFQLSFASTTYEERFRQLSFFEQQEID